ncbi:cytochrome C assembly protein [Deinococcus metallilatus]|uniref:Heme exporter protein C n=1 Tax=Deinococcus metallilatus TaxID=1211322 RepID=A0AAJ5F306_9DEIO|nr:cytochrome c biogenesis protein CcsA [Deinococcus metallilatus]MBB5294265.1 heme exporter protein C [Deinococcus metallilatus]QBY09041.1 cytochrome C assembly protein [Deinococcus metallilatus]RXJ10185.1 cytochrome C assembly protein [Deinococcus metallilatus]TLK27878.1 cytochrome C assembly protein [Deinococcus metallilatus]
MRQDRVTMLLGAVTLLALGTAVVLGLRAPLDVNQGSLVRLMFVHVPTAWLSYLAYGGTGLFGLLYLLTRQRRWDRLALSSAEIGVLFTLATIVGGMLWAKPTWGVYWVWDARLTTTALSLVVYGGYLLIRGLIDDPERRARVSAVIGLVGTLYVPINYMAVEWWRGVHQTQTLRLLGKPSFEAAPIYGWVLLVGTLAFTLLYVYLLRVRGILAAREEVREERELLEDLASVEVARG